MKRNKTILLFVLGIFIMFSSGCNTLNTNNADKKHLPEKIILFDNVWGEVIIDNKIDIQNIVVLKEKMELINKTLDDFQGAFQVSAQLIYPSGKKQDTIFSSQYIKIENEIFIGEEAQNIMNIINSYLFNSKTLNNLLTSSNDVYIYALDLAEKPIKLNQAQIEQFTNSFSESYRAYEDMDILIMSNSEFPNYQASVKTQNNNEIQLRIFNKDFFSIDDPRGISINFRDSGKVINKFKDLYPVHEITDKDILYLFKATKIIMKREGWRDTDISIIKNRIIRSLIYTDKAYYEREEKFPVQLIFYFDGSKQIEVKVYENYIVFNNRRIENDGVGARFFSAYNAN